MHRFQTSLKNHALSFVASVATVGLLSGGALAEVETTAIDFGQNPAASCGVGPVYTGEFDGSSGFVSMAISDCGVVESPTLDLGGGVTFQFTNVSGWNNTDGVGADQLQALTGDHFFSSSLGADDPAGFSVTGLAPEDILILEFVDRRGGEQALVTFEGVTTLVSSDELGEFTDVSGGGVTGATSYSGFFTGPSGSGEGNLAGARITIVRPDAGAPCEGDFNGDGKVDGADFGSVLASWGKCNGCPQDLDGNGFVNGADLGSFLAKWGDCPGGGGGGPSGACCVGERCWELGAVDCASLNGLYEGDGTTCEGVNCEPPTQGICCEANPVVAGCVDPRCANAVCLTLPDCCDVAWDQSCADFAVTECNGCDGSTDTLVEAIDFGQDPGQQCGTSPVFNGTFDSTTGFVGMTLSDCGVLESPVLNVGDGVQLQFINVSGWNNTDGVGPEATQALTGDHFFSGGPAEFGADDPVTFQVTGMNCCDTLILEFVDRRGGESALVTFEGATTLVSSDELGEFTDVSGGGVTGKSTYIGSFTGPEGFGEGNLAGARLVVVPGSPDCDPSSCGSGGGGDCGTCNQVNGGPGCSDDDCQNAVCATDAFCCQIQWDSSCVQKATSGDYPECDC